MPRIVFGLFAPFIITVVVWFIGSPPALSLLWDTADAVVVGHETYEAETGYGLFPFNVPLVKVASSGQTLRMNLPDVPAMDELKIAWPLGKLVSVKLNPLSTAAFAVDDPRRSYIAPMIVLVIAFVVMGLTLSSYFIALDTISLACGAFGLIFISLPLVVMGFRWQIGNPPPTAHFFWPTEMAQIVSQDIISKRIGNGTIRHTPVIKVKREHFIEQFEVAGYLGGFRKDAEQVLDRGGVGTMMKVNISPAGIPFEARWNIQQILTVIFTALLPIFLIIGLLCLRIAWPSKRQRS